MSEMSIKKISETMRNNPKRHDMTIDIFHQITPLQIFYSVNNPKFHGKKF